MNGETKNAVKAGNEIIHSNYYVVSYTQYVYLQKVLRETILVKPTGPTVTNEKRIREEIKSKQHARHVSGPSVKTPSSTLLSNNVKITQIK